MKDTQVGFIGGGRVVRIILEGWKRRNALPGKIVVSDCNAATLASLKSLFPNIETGSNAAAASLDVVFLSVHPPVMADVAASIKGYLKPQALLVSLAPKFTLDRLGGLLDGFTRLARVIPNAPSIINAGYNPVVFGPALTETDRSVIRGLLAPLGESPEVAESKLEAYALITGMGPTYLWFQFQALRELAESFGLSREESAAALGQMSGGALRTLLESGLPPSQVMDLVPVKPLAEMESSVLEMYRTRLPALFQKIKP
jgi:pyrroline-5-carboxylate reductase